MPTEKVHHKEHDHIVQGPNGTVIKDIDIEEDIERVAGGTSHFPSHTSGTAPALESVAEIGTAPTMATRINPRTGKALSIPKPLSLTPQDMSPIVPVDQGGGQLIREEHEEVRLRSHEKRDQANIRPFDKHLGDHPSSPRVLRGPSLDLLDPTEQLSPTFLLLLEGVTQSYATLRMYPTLVLSIPNTSPSSKVRLSTVNPLPKSSLRLPKVILLPLLSIPRQPASPRPLALNLLLSLPILLATEVHHLPTLPTTCLVLVNLGKLSNLCMTPIIRRLFPSRHPTISLMLRVVVLLVHLVHLRLSWWNQI